MESNINEEGSSQNYNIFDFASLKDKKSFEYREFSLKSVYIISKDDYDKGMRYLDNKDSRGFKPNEIHFYSEFKEIKDNLNKIKGGFSLVTEEFLKQLNIDEKEYKNNFVDYFEIDKKNNFIV